jgi:4-amino-4-deoxy-L-arabinose transferase-like glycosyltransferase
VTERDDRRRWRRRVWSLIAGVTAFRLLLIGTTGLGDAEAYYYAWSRLPALSYFDHPPLVAWMVRLTTAVDQTPFWVRLGPVLVSAAFAFLVYRLGERLFSPRAGFISLVVLNLIPAFVVGGFAASPDTPLCLCWMLYLLAVERLRHGGWWYALLAGACLGLGFLSKYTALLLPVGTLAYLVKSPQSRRWLRRPVLYAGLILALAIAVPVLWWNHAHGWPSVHYHLVQRAGELTTWALIVNLGKLLGGQLGYYSPLILPGLLVVLFNCWYLGKRGDDDYRFLYHHAWPVLVFFALVVLRVPDAEPHWTATGYLPLVVAAGPVLEPFLRQPKRLQRIYLWASAGLTVLALALLLVHVYTPLFVRAIPEDSYEPRYDLANELLGWDEVGAAVARAADETDRDAVVASYHYTMCGQLQLAIQDERPVYCASPGTDAFDFLERAEPPGSNPVIYVNDNRFPDPPDQHLQGRRCRQVDSVVIEKGGREVRRFGIFTCEARTDGSPRGQGLSRTQRTLPSMVFES